MIFLVLKKNLSLHFGSKYLLAYEFLSFAFNTLIFVGVSLFISRDRSIHYASYVLPGLGAMEMMTAALVAPKTCIDTEIHSGTLENVLLSVGSLTRLMASESIVLLLRSIAVCSLYLVIAQVLSHGAATPGGPVLAGIHLNLISFLSVVLLFIQFWSLGLLAAGLTLATRRGNGFNTVILLAVSLLGGVYYPIESLPKWFQGLGRLNTLGLVTNSLRNDLGWGELVLPLFMTVLTFWGGVWVFHRFLTWARHEGKF